MGGPGQPEEGESPQQQQDSQQPLTQEPSQQPDTQDEPTAKPATAKSTASVSKRVGTQLGGGSRACKKTPLAGTQLCQAHTDKGLTPGHVPSPLQGLAGILNKDLSLQHCTSTPLHKTPLGAHSHCTLVCTYTLLAWTTYSIKTSATLVTSLTARLALPFTASKSASQPPFTASKSASQPTFYSQQAQ
jgi:hypothetical protein